MKIHFNKTFKDLLFEYNISMDFDLTSIELPAEIKEILNDEIIQNDFGVSMKGNNTSQVIPIDGNLYLNNSQSEDANNHFHVDWLAGNDSILAFKLGIKTLVELSNKFINEGYSNIRFWYSFQSPKMGQQFAYENNIADDEHFISDRLSFYLIREGETVVQFDKNDSSHFAIMWIDI